MPPGYGTENRKSSTLLSSYIATCHSYGFKYSRAKFYIYIIIIIGLHQTDKYRGYGISSNCYKELNNSFSESD